MKQTYKTIDYGSCEKPKRFQVCRRWKVWLQTRQRAKLSDRPEQALTEFERTSETKTNDMKQTYKTIDYEWHTCTKRRQVWRRCRVTQYPKPVSVQSSWRRLKYEDETNLKHNIWEYT